MAGTVSNKSEIFGRKIFFVCATFTLNTNVILRLMDQEFEVYKIDDYRQLKSILTLNPDGIVLINADSTNSANTWYNFVSTLEKTPEFENAAFGIFESKLKKPERDRFQDSLKLKAGYYKIEDSFGPLFGELLGKLDELKAKGIRQFVRYNCIRNKSCEAYFVNGNMMYKMNFIDISSIGVGLLIPNKYAAIARVNCVIQGLTLVLGSKQVKVNAKIHTAKALPEGILAVLIFTPDTPDNIRRYVRNYVCESLQKELMDSVIQLPWDKTDYTNTFQKDEPKKDKEGSKETSAEIGTNENATNENDAGQTAENSSEDSSEAQTSGETAEQAEQTEQESSGENADSAEEIEEIKEE